MVKYWVVCSEINYLRGFKSEQGARNQIVKLESDGWVPNVIIGFEVLSLTDPRWGD